jgi:hypothetical protein
MAHHRRRKPSTRTSPKRYDKWKAKRLKDSGRYYWWMGSWPAWWDVIHHRRPHRRATRYMESAVLRDAVDPDAADWPQAKRPHVYYW